MNAGTKVLMALGTIVSSAGAVFGLLLYLLFTSDDCNPCRSPPAWAWLPLLCGLVLLALGIYRARVPTLDSKKEKGGVPTS